MGVETVGCLRNGITPEEIVGKIKEYIRPSEIHIIKNTLDEEGYLDNEHIMLEDYSSRQYRHAWIDFISASGAAFRLTYIYSNNTALGELERSIMREPEYVPTLTTHAVRLSFCACEESQRMMRRIVALFGGYYVKDDSIRDVVYVPLRDKCKE